MRSMEYQRRLHPAFGGALGAIVYGSGQQAGTQQSTQTQNTTSTSAPSPVIQPYLNNILGQLPGFLGGPMTPPSLYPGPMVAPPSTATQAGWQTLAQIGANGLGYGIDAANGKLTADTLAGKYLDISNNTPFQKALAAAFAPQNENFDNVTTPAMRAQFEGSERNLGGADMDTYLQARKNLDQTQANASATAAENAYTAERGLQTQTQSMLPSFLGMDLTRAGALQQAGAGIDQYNQAATNEAIARDQYAKTSGLDWLLKLAQTAQDIYPGGQTVGTGTSTGFSTGMPASNPAASDIGTILSGLGTVAKFLPFSDVRLKKNIRGPIGRTNAGHNLYRYEFLGSDKPEIGVLAQEVERKDPAAVVRHPSGFKMVDYNRAAPAGGLI